jgi:hypothetical protein
LGFGQVGFAASQFLSQELVLGDVNPCPDKLLDCPSMSRRAGNATYATNFSIRTHDPFREVESSTLCKHPLNGFRDELAIVRVHELHILFYRWGLAARIKAINPEQLWRPVVESSSVEGPTTRTRQALSLRKVELCLFPVFNVEIDADPIE